MKIDRPERIQIAVSAAEKATIEAAATKRGMTVSVWIRDILAEAARQVLRKRPTNDS